MNKHTPTPWVTNNQNQIIGSDVTILIDPEWSALDSSDIKFLISAVNSHEELLAAAKLALEVLLERDNGKGLAIVSLNQAIKQAEVKL